MNRKNFFFQKSFNGRRRRRKKKSVIFKRVFIFVGFFPIIFQSNQIKSKMALRKLQKELVTFQKSEDTTITARPKGDDLFKWTATIAGPAGTGYEGGTFFLDIVCEADYPFTPPKATFTTKVFHPNVNENGGICLDSLKADQWSPSMSIQTILMGIQSLLAAPTAESPLNVEAGTLLKTDKAAYDKKCKEWTQKYAM
jgi:ubiquitin-conjugating enzyme E2 D/E